MVFFVVFFLSPSFNFQQLLLIPYIYIYIYIYIHIYRVIHRQICFVLSELISVARQYLPVAGIETWLIQTSTQASNHSATRRY